MNNQTEIKSQMVLLDIRENDFQNCSNLKEEFTAIQRKSGDLKAFVGPSEAGYANRIREINAAQRMLKKLYDEGKIDSFSQYLRDDQLADDELKDDLSDHGRNTTGIYESNDIERRFL